MNHLFQLIEKSSSDMPKTRFVTDSREVAEGHIFVALKGARVDGHDFVRQAAQKGARAAIVARHFPQESVNIPCFHVDDPLAALQMLAKHKVATMKATCIGITGTVGKTTTKDFLFSLLSSKWRTMCTTGNQNSQVGLSLSLLNNVAGDEEYLVLEMGMTAAGHIRRLVELAPPDIAVLTYISLVHAESFDSLEDIARAKAEIFSHEKTKIACINQEACCQEVLKQEVLKQAILKQPSRHLRQISYSLQQPADFTLQLQEAHIVIHEYGKKIILPRVDLIAPHVYGNFLAACTVARSCGMSWEEIQQALPKLKLPENRLQIIEKKGVTFINDSYNASEEAVKAALQLLRTRPCERARVAVIGQMRELGKYSESCHTNVGQLALECADRMVCFGEETRPIVNLWQRANRPVSWFEDFEELMSLLKKELQPKDVVLVKGSRSNALWRVVEQF